MNQDFADLKDKVAVITGGTGAIGKCLATALSLRGVKLVLAGRELSNAESQARSVAEATGGRVVGMAFDVLDRASMEIAHKEVLDLWGPVDLLVNAAGGNRPAATTAEETMVLGAATDRKNTFFDMDSSGFFEVMNLNFGGTLLPTQVFASDMIGRGGVIMNLSSMAADRPLTKVAGYSASKAAVDNFTRWLAVHLAPQNIRVNALAPGFFLTEQNRFLMLNASGEPTARAKKVIAGTPLGRFGQLEDLVGAALFLLSNASEFVTGVVLPVDGGFGAYSGV